MKARIDLQSSFLEFDLTQPLDLSIPIHENGPKAWYVKAPEFSPVMENGFVGSVAQGGSVNFRNIAFNPHGHGTHTECVGHISKEVHSINKHLNSFFFLASLISIQPNAKNQDLIITTDLLKQCHIHPESKALIIRTLPNLNDKKEINYSNTNPPYLTQSAVEFIVEQGIEHLLLDLPSVDREQDDGKLVGHKTFWNFPKANRMHCTITEFIFVANSIADGTYLLNLQVAAFENDAAPSRPVIYPILNQ